MNELLKPIPMFCASTMLAIGLGAVFGVYTKAALDSYVMDWIVGVLSVTACAVLVTRYLIDRRARK